MIADPQPTGKRLAHLYIRSVKDIANRFPGCEAVLYLRVSHWTQDHNGNLDAQEAYCRRRLAARGIGVVATYRKVESGRAFRDRPELIAAISEADKRDAFLIAASVDRLLRKEDFDSRHNMNAEPTQREFEWLMHLAGGVVLATIVHPAQPPRTVRGVQTKWGQEAKGSKGGRPRKTQSGMKKLRRIALAPRVVAMRRQGVSLGGIAAAVGLPRSTVQSWCEQHGCTKSPPE